MSDQSPPDDEDLGYTSKNQTESLPTSGSVPDLSGTEMSAHASARSKSVDKDNDSKNVQMQRESTADINASIVAGSMASSSATPPSSITVLSPLLTSTPIKNKPSNERDNSSTESAKSQIVESSSHSSKTAITKQGDSTTKAAKSVKPQPPKASRWAALKKQESKKSSIGSLWNYFINTNSSIINIDDTGSDVDGPPKAKPVAKPLWKFNRPAGGSEDTGKEEKAGEAVGSGTNDGSKDTMGVEKSSEAVGSGTNDGSKDTVGVEKSSEAVGSGTNDGSKDTVGVEKSSEAVGSGTNDGSIDAVGVEKAGEALGSGTNDSSKDTVGEEKSSEAVGSGTNDGSKDAEGKVKTDAGSVPKKESSKKVPGISEESNQKEIVQETLDKEKLAAQVPIEKEQSLEAEQEELNVAENPKSADGDGIPSTEVIDQGKTESEPVLPDKKNSSSLKSNEQGLNHVINSEKNPESTSFETDDYTYMNLGTSSASLVKASILPRTSSADRSTVHGENNGDSFTEKEIKDSTENFLRERKTEENTQEDNQEYPLEDKKYPSEEKEYFPRGEEYPLKVDQEYSPNEDKGHPPKEEQEYSPNEDKGFPLNKDKGYPTNEDKGYPQNKDKGYPPKEDKEYPPNEDNSYPQNENMEFPPNENNQFSPEGGKNYQLSEENRNIEKEKQDYSTNEEQHSKQETEYFQQDAESPVEEEALYQKDEEKVALVDLNQVDSHPIPYEVPEALKNYIDPLCTEWQDPNSRKMIYKLAVQKYYSDIGTKFERVDACLLRPSKQQLKSTYSRRDSLKGGPVPGDLLKNMLKQKAAVELAHRHHSFSEEPWGKNTLTTGHVKRKTVSENVGLAHNIGSKDFSVKNSHREKETAEFSHRTPGYGAYSFHNISNLVIPEMEEDEANIAIASRRKSDLDFNPYHMKPSKLALEYSFGRNHKSLPSLDKKGTKELKASFKKRYTNNVEKQEMLTEKNLDNPEQEFLGKTISSDLMKTTEAHECPDDGNDKTDVEVSSTQYSKQPLMFERQEKDDGSKSQERIEPVFMSQLSQKGKKKRSVTDIQKEGYGEVDFNSPTLVLENLEISPDVEGEGMQTKGSECVANTKTSSAEKEGYSPLVINRSTREDEVNHTYVTSENAVIESKDQKKVSIACDDSPKPTAVNSEIEAIKLMLQRKLDEQSALLQKQSLLSAVILQSLQKGHIQEEDLNTLVSLHQAGEIDLEKSTPKNIMMLQPKEKVTNTITEGKKNSLTMAKAQGPKNKDYSLPSEVLKRKLEKEIMEKRDKEESPNTSVDKGYGSDADSSFSTENNSPQKHYTSEAESETRRFCFSSTSKTDDSRDMRDLLEILNPTAVFNSTHNDEELSLIMTPSSSSFNKSYSGRKSHGLSKSSNSNMDDYNEEIISYYNHDDSDSRSLKKMSSQNDKIYEMGSNMQLCNLQMQPSKETLKVQDPHFPPFSKNKTEYSPREINAEPGAEIYKLRPVVRDVQFKDSPLCLRVNEGCRSELSEPVSSVASFPHIDSLQVTANQSYQALSDDGYPDLSEESINLPPKRVTSIWDFVKLLYNRDPAFVQQSLSSADCDYHTLQQLLRALSSSTPGKQTFSNPSPLDFRDYAVEVKKYVTLKKSNKDNVLIYTLKPPPKLKSGSPRKRSLPSVSPRSMTPEARSWLMEKEVLESQTRKLQMEVSTLSTENKILKQRLDRTQVTMEDLEGRLANNREEMDSVYLTLQKQQREAERHAHDERTEEYAHLQTQIERLTQENHDLKFEVSTFEKHLDAAEKASSQVRLSSEKTKTLEAYKMEILTLREEVGKVKALLEQSEHHLQDEEVRNRELNQQVIRLTEMKNLLQQQIDKGGGGTVSDKQIKSLEKRLKITEERLHQERADRANNLSEVEDKLLTENARLQAVEKELNRQLQREKDKNRNLDSKVKDTREEVERLRLALPFDESTLTSDKLEEYDIPYSKHSNQRLENKKTPDYKYVMGQVEQQSGLTIGQEKEVICHLWSTRETTYQKLRHLQSTLQDLDLPDNDYFAGLKHLRDMKGQYESKLHQLEEKLHDSQSQLATFETTYKEQLNTLVKERHDSFARLKTTEDLLEALKGENEILKASFPGTMGTKNTNARDSQVDDLKVKLKNLESDLHHLQTRNQVLEGEVHTLRVQLEAKEKALEDAQTEADLANSRLNNTDAIERKEERIQKLHSENQNLQTEIRILSEKNSFLTDEKKRSDTDLSNSQRELSVLKSRQRDGSAGDLADNKYVQSLQEELHQKDVQLSQSARDLQTVEKELKQTRVTMYSEQAQMANLQAQVDSLRDQVEQKNLILDAVGGSESDSQSHYNSLKETLESMSQELALVQAQNKTLQAEVNRERSRCEVLKEEVSRTSVHSEPREKSELELQIQQLEEERDRLQEELVGTAQSSEELTQNVIDSQSEAQKLQQDLSSEQAKLLHMSAQKGELEQHLEEIAEEHDALIQEKSQNEEDIVKLENKLQELVQTLESQHHHDNHQTQYSDVSPELRKMTGELDSIRTLLDAKAREMEMLQDKLSRQNMETEFLQRRVELLHSENQCNREDIARLTGELANKIKESSSLKEVNQLLSRERGKVQRLREMEDKEKAREREHSEKYRKEVAEAIHKLKEEKNSSSKTDREELKLTNQRLDLLSSEHERVLNSLNAEKQATAQLQADLQKYQRECAELREQLQRVTLELETVRAQLSARDETIENLKQDKGAFYQEYDSMCRRLAEKEEKIEKLQQRYDLTVDNMKQEFSQQKLNLEQERTSAESDLDKAKDTINFLNEEIKQKDAQLVTFGRTLHELEEASKKKHELEQQVETLEHDQSSVRQMLQNHQREIESHQSTISRMQEIHAKLQVEKTRLNDQLREEKESSGREIQLLRKSLSDMESLHEGEKAYLKENLSQTQSRLQAMETSLASAVEARDKYQMTNRMLEHSLEDNKNKLQEESTCYRVAEKKSESLQSQLNESRRERFLTEDKLNQCQTNLVKIEKEMRAERDRCQDLEERIQELEAVSATQQSTLRAKQEQVDVLQSEIGKLRQIIDGQKQQLGGKLKKSAQEFKQQLDLVEMEKDQLSKQNKQLTFDLEKARETIQSKNKDNLKLQEDILNLEEQIRERSSKLRKVEDNLKVEEEIQSKLASRYQEQEDEVKRMKNFLSKKAEEATDADKSMWQDMSKVIQDMSLKIQQHFEGTKERENQHEQDLKLIKKYKKQVRDLESDLSTERAVHSITKSSLQALEEDCQRLRKQFMASKRRDKSSADKPSKSRMEAINEIIARSQTQAQNMLAAGGYFEETLRSITTPRGANNNYNDGSPDTSIASDFSFNSVSPVVIAAYPSQAKSPRK